MSDEGFELYGEDVNTLVCNSFSDGYVPLFEYVRKFGAYTDSRIGATKEVLNFKTVLLEPLKRCTIAYKRNSNIFFHLAESLWVLTGRNDLEFMQIFNSRFNEYSDDGKILHGAYGHRLRNESSDQLLKICQLLDQNPDLRRSVVSLWNADLDLGKPFKDIPCNTQLMFRVKNDHLYTTVVNRSNDLHWGVIANIFQFSMLSEVISLLINKRYYRQTHFSLSLHYYLNNDLNETLVNSNLGKHFYQNYPEAELVFNFENPNENFPERFNEIDTLLKKIPELILRFMNDPLMSLTEALKQIDDFKRKSQSFFEIAYLLLIYVSYKKDLAIDKDMEQSRAFYLNLLHEKKFMHKDFWGMAMNFFASRLKNKATLKKFGILDIHLGDY